MVNADAYARLCARPSWVFIFRLALRRCHRGDICFGGHLLRLFHGDIFSAGFHAKTSHKPGQTLAELFAEESALFNIVVQTVTSRRRGSDHLWSRVTGHAYGLRALTRGPRSSYKKFKSSLPENSL